METSNFDSIFIDQYMASTGKQMLGSKATEEPRVYYYLAKAALVLSFAPRIVRKLRASISKAIPV